MSTMSTSFYRSLLVAATVAIGATAPALADDDRRCATGTGEWMNVQAITARAEKEGYTVREVERDDGCYEIKGVDAKGQKVEARFNPYSGELVKVERDDD